MSDIEIARQATMQPIGEIAATPPAAAGLPRAARAFTSRAWTSVD